MVRARLTPVLLAPSARINVLMGRPPPTLKLQPGHVVTLAMTGFSAARVAAHIRQRQREIQNAAVKQGHVLNLAGTDGRTQRSTLGVDLRGLGLDCHLRSGGAGFESDIERGDAGGIDLDVVDQFALEALRFDLQPVGDRFECWEAICA